MPRIPEENIGRLKRQVSLVEVVQASGVKPSAHRLPAEEVERLLALPDAKLLHWVLGVYRDQISDSPLQNFLESRSLCHPSLIDQFQLGYSTGALSSMLPAKASQLGAAIRGRLQRLGILRTSGREHLSGRLVTPLWTAKHGLGQLYGCAISPGMRSGTPDHLYLEGPRSHCIFHPGVVERFADLILCESPIDALAYWSNGLRNVTSACGSSSFPEALFESMKRQSTRRVLMAYAHDEAGDRGAQRVAERLLSAGIECYRVAFPKGMTVGAIAMSGESAPKELREGLRQASMMGSGRPPSEVVPEMPSQTAARKELQNPEEAAREREQLSSSAARAISPISLISLTAPRPSEIPAGISQHELVVELGDRRFRALLQLEELEGEPIGGAFEAKAMTAVLLDGSAGAAREERSS